MIHTLVTKAESDEMLDQFKAIDKDGDGQLSKQELLDGYYKIYGVHLDQETTDNLMKNLDKNKSGYIDYSGKLALV